MHTHTHTHKLLLTYSTASTSIMARMSMVRISRTTSTRRSRTTSACARGAGRDEAHVRIKLATGDEGRARGGAGRRWSRWRGRCAQVARTSKGRPRAPVGWRGKAGACAWSRGQSWRWRGRGSTTTTGGAVDPNQIWARVRMTAADPGLGVVHRRERRESGRRQRRREIGEARGGG
jgi:hypothetical protein